MIKERFIELIDKYISGKASDTEQHLVEEYVKRLDANENVTLDNLQEQQIKEAMWQQIQLKTTQRTTAVVQMRWYQRRMLSIAVAASITLLIGFGIWLFTNNTPEQRMAAARNDKRVERMPSVVRHEVNTTGKQKRFQLPDGSIIVLENKSEISYQDPFTVKRAITLTGKAWFKVVKDKTKPFTVISGDISTTALGTEFAVTAFAKANEIIVRLYEGKVVVKAVGKTNKRMKNDVYLIPGQELIYGGAMVKVRTFKTSSHAAPEGIIKEEIPYDNPSIPENTKSSYFMFNNQSLAQVLDDLAALYQVKIFYYKKDLKNIYFTGKYNRSDSLEPILKRIGTLNNLKITKKDNAFIISK